jgi:staphylopine/pseudopaline/yersinopine synthase
MKKTFGRVLIAGAGPAGIQVAVNFSEKWSNLTGIVNRQGMKSERLKKELENNKNNIIVEMNNERTEKNEIKTDLDYFYEGFQSVEDIWDTLVICVPSDCYKEVIKKIDIKKLKNLKTILLISPGIGSTLLIESKIKECKREIEIITFSTYYAATKFKNEEETLLTVICKAVKKRVYISSSKDNSEIINLTKEFLRKLGIDGIILKNSLEVEIRNITTYVHPPFFLTEFSLNEIIKKERSIKYMYKIYPEGPITQYTIKSMVNLWKEISNVLSFFKIKPINLLKFLNDDNYPLKEESLSREDIENFCDLEEIKQEYLLYIRYSSILINPFSEPDINGKYFDFSAVPFKQVYKNIKGEWVIPRIPIEDYKRIKLICEIADKIGVKMNYAKKMIDNFEIKIEEFKKNIGEEKIDSSIFNNEFGEDAEAIINQMELKI